MKKELHLVLKNGEKAFAALEHLKAEGYNATVVSTESLRHAIDDYPGDHHFFSLRHYEKAQELESVLCLFVVEADRLEHLKEIVRECTNGFRDIKGFMYSREIDDYEGSI